MILRRIARPMLAAGFVAGGLNTMRDPKSHVVAAEPLLDRTVGQVADRLPEQVPTDTESLVKLDAAVKIGAGALLALGRFPRLSAVLLAGSVVPTTLAAHRFWEIEDPGERVTQQVHFLKNLGLLGGLLLAAADTRGRPSLGWRARRAAKITNRRLHDATDTVRSALPG